MRMRTGFVVALSLLWSNMAMADASHLWTVSLVTTGQPYLCNECGLKTPFPDAASTRALNAWKSVLPPFVGPVNDKGFQPIQSGDRVTLCNASGCSTYTWEAPLGWVHGVFQHQESHAPRSAG